MFDPALPFVLLDDVAAGTARLFTGLVEVVSVAGDAADAVPAALRRLCEPGPWAGFVGFEAGYALEAVLPRREAPAGEPLLWFGRFDQEQELDPPTLLDVGMAQIGDVVPGLAAASHAAQLQTIKALIEAGDIYQANLTFNALVAVGGHPLAIYARLRGGSQAPYGALVFTGRLWVLSFSPELFFRMDGRCLTARPMKGTAARGFDTQDDAGRAKALQGDPKNRAENLMITDLLRNDLSKVAEDVAVTALFEVETYPTVLQMTSTITAHARPGVTPADVLVRLFPCGSVTGAPKIRAMQVIADIETAPRGVYTGSIGAISGGNAVFNVAIRTLVMTAGAGFARLGLGSGIIADSDAASEWTECLQKAAFLSRRGTPDLIETLRCEAGIMPDLDRHLARMRRSAAFLGLAFDVAEARAMLVDATAGLDGRIRLLAAPSGALAVQVAPLPVTTPAPWQVRVVPLPVAADDWRLRHKTSDRAFYDVARRNAGSDEVVFVRPDGLVTEGSFTNIFVRRGDRLLTPAASAGLLPGVLRARLMAEGLAVEADLAADDLAEGFLLGNALRGLLPAVLVE